jgi:hypothetical protein
MFKTYSQQHNKGIHVGFVKPSECRMAGEHIALLRLLRLKNALKSTIASKEFIDLKSFRSEVAILSTDAFWKYLFVMCRALYAPMRVLRLADQKTPAMDKLYYYVRQTDEQLPKWMKSAEEHAKVLLTDPVLEVMKGSSFADPIVDVLVDDDDGGDDEDDIDDDDEDADKDDGEVEELSEPVEETTVEETTLSADSASEEGNTRQVGSISCNHFAYLLT